MKGFRRPEVTVLSESSGIPPGHVVPPPEEFTHELARDAAYRYDRRESRPIGTLAAGTKVHLVDESDGTCRVVDPRGLSVTIDKDALRKL